jgi:hypothetical protein
MGEAVYSGPLEQTHRRVGGVHTAAKSSEVVPDLIVARTHS